jgi:hypothetical protein
MIGGLLRLLFSLAMLLLIVWFTVSVPLGKRTLWGHLRAIAGTEEAKDLADGTKQEAEKVVHRVKEELHPPDMAPGARRVRAPLDAVDEHDRQRLDKLVKDKTR